MADEKKELKKIQVCRAVISFLSRKNNLQDVRIYQIIRLTKTSSETLHDLFFIDENISLKEQIYEAAIKLYLFEKLKKNISIKELFLWLIFTYHKTLNFKYFFNAPRIVRTNIKKKTKRKNNNGDFSNWFLQLNIRIKNIIIEYYINELKKQKNYSSTKETQLVTQIESYFCVGYGILFSNTKSTLSVLLNVFKNATEK